MSDTDQINGAFKSNRRARVVKSYLISLLVAFGVSLLTTFTNLVSPVAELVLALAQLPSEDLYASEVAVVLLVFPVVWFVVRASRVGGGPAQIARAYATVILAVVFVLSALLIVPSIVSTLSVGLGVETQSMAGAQDGQMIVPRFEVGLSWFDRLYASVAFLSWEAETGFPFVFFTLISALLLILPAAFVSLLAGYAELRYLPSRVDETRSGAQQAEEAPVLRAAVADFLDEAPPGLRIVLATLFEMIRETKTRASRVLALILGLLVVGVLVIAFAGQITSLDLIAGNATNEIRNERSQLQSRRLEAEETLQIAQQEQSARGLRLERLGFPAGEMEGGEGKIYFGSLRDYANEMSENPNLLGVRGEDLRVIKQQERDAQSTHDPETAEPVEHQSRSQILSYLRSELQDGNTANRAIDRQNRRLESIDLRLAEIEDMIDAETQGQINQTQADGVSGTQFLLASGITRFGIVAIIVYIIQILVSLYRYNMRLNAFYIARLKALVLAKQQDKSIEELKAYFDASGITFGKDAVSPTSEIVELIRTGFESAAKTAVAVRGGSTAP